MFNAIFCSMLFIIYSCDSNKLNFHSNTKQLLIELHVHIGNYNWWTIRRPFEKVQKILHGRKKRAQYWLETGQTLLKAMLALTLWSEWCFFGFAWFQMAMAGSLLFLNSPGFFFYSLLHAIDRGISLAFDVCYMFGDFICKKEQMLLKISQPIEDLMRGFLQNFIVFYICSFLQINLISLTPIGILIFVNNWTPRQVEPIFLQEIGNPYFREKIQIWVKMPDEKTITIFPNIGTQFSELIKSHKFNMIDRRDFFLKANSSIKLVTEEHRSITIRLIRKLRGGSTELQKANEELRKEFLALDKEICEKGNKFEKRPLEL